MSRSLPIALALLVPAIASAIPMSLHHQGRLLDSTGAALTGPHDVAVTLYDDTDTVLWTDTFTGVNFEDGYFAVELGSGEALDAGVLAGDLVFVGLAVDDTDLGSRQQLHSVPYAIRAGTAHSVKGGTVDVSEVLIDGTTVLDSNGLASSFSTDTLADLACNDGEIVKRASGAWACADDAINNDASALTTGILSPDRLQFGVNQNEVAQGNHGHTLADLTGDLPASRITGLDTGPVQLENVTTCDGAAEGVLRWTGDAVEVCDGTAWSSISPAIDGSTAAQAAASCQALLDDGYDTSGAYWLDTGNGPFRTWCDQQTDGGGWALALRVADSGTTFKFFSPHWTTDSTLNADADFDPASNADAKFASFNDVAGSEIRGCMRNISSGAYFCKVYDLPTADRTLLQTFTDVPAGSRESSKGHYFDETRDERLQWVTGWGQAITGTSTYVDTGINVDDDLSCYHGRVRFGLALNNETNINTMNDAAGFGASSYWSSNCAASEGGWQTSLGYAVNSNITSTRGHLWVR